MLYVIHPFNPGRGVRVEAHLGELRLRISRGLLRRPLWVSLPIPCAINGRRIESPLLFPVAFSLGRVRFEVRIGGALPRILAEASYLLDFEVTWGRSHRHFRFIEKSNWEAGCDLLELVNGSWVSYGEKREARWRANVASASEAAGT